MKVQLLQVLRTYARRPLVRMIAALALLTAIGLFANGFSRGSSHVSIEPKIQLRGNWAWIEPGEWSDYFREHRAGDLTALQVVDQPPADFPDLTPLVNLNSLRLSSYDFGPRKLEEVASLEELQALALQAPSIPEGSWTRLGPKLLELEVPVRLLLSRADEVPQLVELQTLRVDCGGLTPDALSVIAQIPNLKYLSFSWQLTDDYVNLSDSQPASTTLALTPDNLRPLAGHPSLEAIFAYWPPQTPRTIPTLPGVQLYPATVSKSWQSAMLLSLFFTAAIAVLVVLQAWTHFIVQSAAVIPGYARPHQLAAIIILLGGILVGAAGLWLAEIAMIPGATIALTLPTAILAIFSMIQSRSQIIVRTICLPLGFLAAALVWFPVAFGASLPPVIAGEAAWFLQGEFTWIAMMVLLGEAAVLGYAIVQLPKVTHRVYETSSLRPGLSPWDPQQQRRQAYGSQKRSRWLPDPGARLAKLRGGSTWQMAQLWRAGNAYRPWIVVLALGGVFSALQISFSVDWQTAISTIFGAGMFQMAVFLLVFPLTVWYRRCESLRVESLRPVSRERLIRQLFTALAIDQSAVLIPAACLIGYTVWFSRFGAREAEAATIALGVTSLVWEYALCTAVFAIRRAWVLVGYIATMHVLPLALLAVVVFAVDMPDQQRFLILYIPSLVVAVLAAGLIVLTYRRSLRREWG